jgi:phosphoribosylglycinamide formyltransferase-1
LAPPLSVAVLVSGTGTTLDALAQAVERESIPARIALVVADRPDAPAAAVAARHRLEYVVVRARGRPADEWSAELDQALTAASVELVVLAGFLSILPPPLLERWAGRTINVHPSLLPRHGGPGQYGHRVYESILASGDRESGATVHLVTPDVDAGPVLIQDRFPLEAAETVATLQQKTQARERRLLAEAVRRFADGRWPLPYGGSDVGARGSDRPAEGA